MNVSILIGKKLHPMSYAHNQIEGGLRAETLLREDRHNEYIQYERPYFNSPNLEKEAGNIYSFINLLEDCMRQYGYFHEATEILHLCEQFFVDTRSANSSNYNKYQENIKKTDSDLYECFINDLALFLDMQSSIARKIIDGQIYEKVNKTPKELFNLKEFNKTDLNSVKHYDKNGFDFAQTNTYNRSIFNYVSSLDSLNYLWSKNQTLKNNGNNYINIFHLDEFNSSLLHTAKSIETYQFFLKQMIVENKQVSSFIFKGQNIWGKPACEKFTDLFVKWITSTTPGKFSKEEMEPFVHTLIEIEKIDPHYALEFEKIIKNKNNMMKLLQSDQYSNTDKFYDNFLSSFFALKLDLNLPEKSNKNKVKI